jgi:hypothetical protein
MRGSPGRFAIVLVTASVVAASCSASPSAAKHAPTTTSAANSGSGNTGSGNTGSGNTGSGSTTTTTPGSTTTTGDGGKGTTTTTPGSNAVTTTTPSFVINPSTGKVQRRVAGPEIVKFKPVSSPVGGTVLIVGKRLAHAQAVAFDGLKGTITSNSATKIFVVVPAGATTGPISVVTVTGSVTVAGFVVT